MILKLLPIVFSSFSIILSLTTAYFQWFRRVLEGRISVLSVSWEHYVKDDEFIIPIEISVSNQGNKPFIISKIWLLHDTQDGNRRYLESDQSNPESPIKAMPNSVEFRRLLFKHTNKELVRDLEGKGITDIDLLCYVIDDKGNESYSYVNPLKVVCEGGKIERFDFKPISQKFFSNRFNN